MKKIDPKDYNTLKEGDILYIESFGVTNNKFGPLDIVKGKLISIASKKYVPPIDAITDNQKKNKDSSPKIIPHHIVFENIDKKVSLGDAYHCTVIGAGQFMVYKEE